MVSLCWGGPWPPWAHIQLPSTAYPWYAQALPEASHTPPLYCMGFSMLSLSESNSQSGLTLSICQLFYNPSGEGQYWLWGSLEPPRGLLKKAPSERVLPVADGNERGRRTEGWRVRLRKTVRKEGCCEQARWIWEIELSLPREGSHWRLEFDEGTADEGLGRLNLSF